MKASELRIGNAHEYLIQDSVDERKQWWEKTVITSEDIVWLQNNPDDNSYRPIPLTEEWLVKFGFKKESMAYSLNIDLFNGGKRLAFSGDYLYIIDSEKQNTIPTDIVTLWNKDVMKQFYVHQLQNLYFALTGEELEIKE